MYPARAVPARPPTGLAPGRLAAAWAPHTGLRTYRPARGPWMRGAGRPAQGALCTAPDGGVGCRTALGPPVAARPGPYGPCPYMRPGQDRTARVARALPSGTGLGPAPTAAPAPAATLSCRPAARSRLRLRLCEARTPAGATAGPAFGGRGARRRLCAGPPCPCAAVGDERRGCPGTEVPGQPLLSSAVANPEGYASLLRLGPAPPAACSIGGTSGSADFSSPRKVKVTVSPSPSVSTTTM